ncbi:MAG: hypothetical protein IJ563_11855 [Selenomonadaceae bacterium]|nr:hypothetical protein [Selenomonadaceae bacterium]MBR1859781.1 hypothetical protein [Selenomonadaceae bacterium]
MQPVKVLIFGIDDMFPLLKPYYDKQVECGNMDIIGYAVFSEDKILFIKNLNGEPLKNISCQKVIISSQNNFMPRFKMLDSILHAMGGGHIFQ